MPIWMSAPVLTEFAESLLQAAGTSREEAQIVARNLVGANLRGHDSHGVLRLPQYVGFLQRGEYRAGVELTIEHEAPAVVSCDAQWGLGQVQAHRLLDRVIPRAQRFGLAAGTARRCGHIGRLGEYAERAATEGLILLATVNNGGAGQRVAPPGGTEPRLGTNPLCMGSPTGSDPLVLDFSTSAVAEGKVRSYYFNNRTPVPEGWLLDYQGRPTTNPSVLYEPPTGSIRPMGGDQAYKGFGLAVLLDLLVGGLSGGRACHPGAGAARGNNVLFLALDPAHFSGTDTLVGEADQLTTYLRSCRLASGVETIRLPGEPERQVLASRSASGIPLENAHWSRLTELAQGLGVPLPASGSNPA